MRFNLSVGVACLIAVLPVPKVLSQPVVVSVKPTGGTEAAYGIAHASGVDFEIDVGAISAAFPGGFDYIRVRDSTFPSGVDIGVITLTNPSNVQLPTEVRLLVTRADEDVPGFPLDITRSLAPACHDWEGLAFASTGLDDARVILSAAVANDITGSVSCGQVYTLQALVGTIAGDVIAAWPDSRGPDDGDDPPNGPPRDYSIQSIRAKQITGSIIAGDPVGPPTNMSPASCSIRSVVVGERFPESSAGIQGNILAYGGHIRHIESTGPIGSAATQPPLRLHAGYGVGELLCRVSPTSTVPCNVYADLRTNFMPPLTNSNLDNDGFIRQVRVSGDFHGSIEANILRPRAVAGQPCGYAGTNPDGTTYGIDVAGVMDAPVTFRQGVLAAFLHAAEFAGPITMETYLKGEVVATAGGIASLTVGNNPHEVNVWCGGLRYWTDGVIGGDCVPEWQVDEAGPFPFSDHNPVYRDEPRSLIRAHTSIGTLDLSSVVVGNKIVPAMIEAPVMGVVRIGSFEHGVIWSGVRTDCTPSADPAVRCGADPDDPASYVAFGDVEIGDAVGRHWQGVEGRPEYDTGIYGASFDRFDVLRRTSADLYFDRIAEAEHLRVGCAHGYQFNQFSGLIGVRQIGGLQGQVTVNAHAATDVSGACDWSHGHDDIGWWEHVKVPAPTGSSVDPYALCPYVHDTTTQQTYHDPSSEADEGPYYDRLSAALGGGACP